MAVSSILQAFHAVAAFPAVWQSGIAGALGILGTYLAYTALGIWSAAAVVIFTLLILPFFFAGTYGVLLDNNKKKGAFFLYSAHGYFKTLRMWLFFLLVIITGSTLPIILKISGISYTFIVIIPYLIIFPIIFYCYFADISAIRYNLSIGRAIKDSARKVSTAPFSIIAFYMFNILLIIFILPLIFRLSFSLFAGEEGMNILTKLTADLTELGQSGITVNPESVSSNQLILAKAASMTQGGQMILEVFKNGIILRALSFSVALITLVSLPFLVSYKTCYYQKMLQIQQKTRTPQLGQKADGEFDEKGRWFKYK